MSSKPKIVPIRANVILTASDVGHRFTSEGFDEGAFLFDWDAKENGAVLNIKFAFAKDRNLDVTDANWFSQMQASDDAISVLTEKSFTFTATAIQKFRFVISLPLMDVATRVQVFETSTIKGDLAIDAVGTSIGRH